MLNGCLAIKKAVLSEAMPRNFRPDFGDSGVKANANQLQRRVLFVVRAAISYFGPQKAGCLTSKTWPKKGGTRESVHFLNRIFSALSEQIYPPTAIQLQQGSPSSYRPAWSSPAHRVRHRNRPLVAVRLTS